MSAPRRATAAGPRSIAVTGSKGGVGKSNLAVNLAVAFRGHGRRVLLVDGDLGLASLDVLLGIVPRHTIEDLLDGTASLRDLIVEGPSGVLVLPSASGVPDLARLDDAMRDRLLASLREGASLVDDLIVDTGAGLGATALALQLSASRVVIVTTPEPTSLVDAYASLKVLWNADPAKRVDLVVNQAASAEDGARAYEQIAAAARQFLGGQLGWLGSVYRDPCVGEAVRRQRAVLDLHPACPAARCYAWLALRLLGDKPDLDATTGFWERLLEAAPSELLQ